MSSRKVTKNTKKPTRPQKARKGKSKPKPPIAPKFGQTHKLLSFLRKSDGKTDGRSLRTIDERKIKTLSESDSETVSTLFVNPLTVYRFRLGGHTTLTMTAGVINTFLAADPSAAGWNSPEWATFSALFSEFKLVQLGVHVVRNFNTTGLAAGPLAICSNLGTAVNPGSYANCADNADVVWYSYASTSNSGKTHVMHGTDLNWSEMTTPTATPYAGAPGSIQFYAINDAATGTVSQQFHVLIWGLYDFRIRV